MTEHFQTDSVASEYRQRAILVIAHPGHELRVHGWLEATVPAVWILTDGSGHTGRSRIDSTTRVLEPTGAVPGPVYGSVSDADLYNTVLGFNHRPFIDIVDKLAAAILHEQVDCIAGDAEEGYNPGHDICRLIINAAVKLVKHKSSKPIRNYDFTLAGPPDQCPEDLREHSLWLNLDDEAFARKLSAARNYPELQAEVETALNGAGNETLTGHSKLAERLRTITGVTDARRFRVECLRPVNTHSLANRSLEDDPPYYEQYGEKQVKSGYYRQVLRYSEHMLPLARALDSHVERTVNGGPQDPNCQRNACDTHRN
jgi:hypothetical protein